MCLRLPFRCVGVLLTTFALGARPVRGQDAPPGGPDPALGIALAEVVDLPTPAARRAAADRLARRAGVTLETWLEVARRFEPAGPSSPGLATERAALPVLDGVEPTELVVFVPPGLDASRPAPLILSLHGAGGAGAEAVGLWRGVAAATGTIVVAPTEAGPNEGYRFSPRERAAALAALRWARRRFDVDERRVVVAGVSRGGHLAWDLALRHPDLFAGMVSMIGAPRLATQHGANNLRFLENVLELPLRALQGARDDERAVQNLRWAFERLRELGARDAVLVEFPDRGHDFDFGAVDWGAFLEAAQRPSAPTRVRRRVTRAAEGRAGWIEILEVEKGVEDEPKVPQPAGWDRMTELARRRFLAAAVEARTARLDVTRTAPGRFEATSSGVRRFRLLLDAAAFVPGQPVVVSWNGRAISRTATPSATVLLREFAERFDRSFLPVVEVLVP